MPSSEISNFYKMPVEERLKIVKDFARLEESEAKAIGSLSGLKLETADHMIENVIGASCDLRSKGYFSQTGEHRKFME